MCVKNTTYNKCDNGVWSPTNYSTWVVEHVELPIDKTNTPPRKEFSLAPIKKIVTLVLPSTADMLSLHSLSLSLSNYLVKLTVKSLKRDLLH